LRNASCNILGLDTAGVSSSGVQKSSCNVDEQSDTE
jgi:hypothetical protein